MKVINLETNSIISIFLISFLCININAFSQFKSMSGLHDTIDTSLEKHLKDSGFGKVTYYFDNLNNKDGEWELYPFLKITDKITAVYVSSIPDNNTEYTFIVFFNSETSSVTDTLGPFYDTFVDAIKVKLSKNQIKKLTVRLANPPEPYDPKYTFIEYIMGKSRLIESKHYDRK